MKLTQKQFQKLVKLARKDNVLYDPQSNTTKVWKFLFVVQEKGARYNTHKYIQIIGINLAGKIFSNLVDEVTGTKDSLKDYCAEKVLIAKGVNNLIWMDRPYPYTFLKEHLSKP